MSKYLDNMKLYFSKWIIPFCIFLAFLLFYLYTMFDGIGGRINYGDSAKWQYLHYVNGLPHGPGYPQFLILTELFSRIIFFLPDTERVTFISVFFGAIALSIFYLLLNILTGNRWGSLVATIFFGITYTFWTQATEAEVYTLNVAYLLLVFYLFIKYHQTEQSRFFMAGCIVYALSFGNHLSMITILPALVFITFTSNYKKVLSARNIGIIAVTVLLGALQYVFVFYRAYQIESPLYREIVKDPSFSEFMTYITGPKDIMFQFSFTGVLFDRMKLLSAYVIDELSIIGIILSFAGFFYWMYATKTWKVPVFLALALIGQITFHISYAVADLIVFFLPVYMLMALFSGLVFLEKRKSWVWGVLFFLNMCLLVGYNIRGHKVLKSNIYDVEHFALIREMYGDKKLPLYFPVFDNYYYWAYINYLNVSGVLSKEQEILLNPTQLEQVDSFYVVHGHLGFVDHNLFDVEPVVVLDVLSFVKNKSSEDNAIFISVCDEAAGNMDRAFKEYLSSKRGKIEQLDYRGAYCAVIANNMLLDKVDNDQKYVKIDSKSLDELEPLIGGCPYMIESAGLEAGSFSFFRIKNSEYRTGHRGVNIVVWDIRNERISTIASFDTHSGNLPTLYKVKHKNS